MSPLETLKAWYQPLPADVHYRLAFGSLVFLGHPTSGNVEADYLAWLNESLPFPAHVGRAVTACAIVEFIMEESGRASWWDEILQVKLDLVERVDATTKGSINRQIGNHEEHRAQWLAAARLWWQLRANELHNETLRQWMVDQIGE